MCVCGLNVLLPVTPHAEFFVSIKVPTAGVVKNSRSPAAWRNRGSCYLC